MLEFIHHFPFLCYLGIGTKTTLKLNSISWQQYSLPTPCSVLQEKNQTGYLLLYTLDTVHLTTEKSRSQS